MRANSQKISIMGLFISIALVLNLIERMFPVPFGVPGAKLGFANIITIVCLMVFGYKDTFLVLISRIILGAVFGGGVSGFLYSVSGGILSFIMMVLLIQFVGNRVSLIGISVTGAFFHSVGQVIMAVILFQNIRLLGYLPMMLMTSILSGIFVGFVGERFRRYLEVIVKRADYE